MKVWIYSNGQVSIIVKDIDGPFYDIPVYRLLNYHLWRRKNKKVRISCKLFEKNNSFVIETKIFPPISPSKIIHFMKADNIYFHEILRVLKENKN